MTTPAEIAKRSIVFITILLALVMTMIAALQAQTRQYNDPVTRLDRRLADRQAKLDYSDAGWGYLRSFLDQLDINTDSQILVFSKTSFQQDLISPQKPRALYFNDDTVIGAVQDASVFELVSLDPAAGLQFFSLDQKKVDAPRFKRESGSCTFCHGPINRYAQGIMIATVFPATDGKPTFPTASGLFKLTDHRTPFEERWGGYYVTGTHGSIKHLANAVAPDSSRPSELDRSNSSNVTSLQGRFDISKYLAPTSDMIALMTLEHQTGLVNILTSVGAQFRASETFPLPPEQLAGEVDRLIKYMLFIGETKLESPLKGVSAFTKTFANRGPRDSKGRSLRDFDLQTRMFRYPLSYMIYSVAFDGLPSSAREKIYQRLYDVLTGRAASGEFAELSAERRREILEILVETKKGLPEYFEP